jgi:hypothetical protein
MDPIDNKTAGLADNKMLPREVCLKHRKIRREIFQRVRVHDIGLAVVFVFIGSFSHVDHVVTVASRPVTAAVPVRVRLVNHPKLRQRSSRLLPGRAGRTSLRVHHPTLTHENKHHTALPIFSHS